MSVHPLAGKPAPRSILVHVPRLVAAYYTLRPDPAEPSHRVAFGTSGHRGSSLKHSLNEAHILGGELLILGKSVIRHTQVLNTDSEVSKTSTYAFYVCSTTHSVP